MVRQTSGYPRSYRQGAKGTDLRLIRTASLLAPRHHREYLQEEYG